MGGRSAVGYKFYGVSKERAASCILKTEAARSRGRLLNFLLDCTTSHPRRQYSSKPSEYQILHTEQVMFGELSVSVFRHATQVNT